MAKLAVVSIDQPMVSPARAALSPGRAALAAHRDEIAAAATELARARVPYDRIRASVELAETVQRDAQARLDEANRQAAAELARGAMDGAAGAVPSIVSGRARMVDDVAAAEQAVTNAKAAAGLLAPSLGAAEARHAALTAQLDTLLIAALVEEAAVARTRLAEAQTAAIAAEATVRGLQAAIVERADKLKASGADATPWLRAAELMAFAFGAMPRSELSYAETQRRAAMWAALIAALPSDPSAAVT